MLLKDLIPCEYDVPIDLISDDSRTKGKNILFVAVKGLTVDGHDYIKGAVENGAVAVVCEHEVEGIDIPMVIVKDSQRAMNEMLNRFYGAPLGRLTMIGVTGTDGKTTTSEVIFQILNMLGHKTGYIGTNGIRSEHYTQENDYTTPLQEELFKALNGFKKDRCEFVSMEATGERLGTGKMDGVSFDASIFTNLTRDALDIFKTMDNYAAAKAKLMEYTKSTGICVINADDPYKHFFIKHSSAPVITYGIDEEADLFATDIEVGFDRLSFTLNGDLGTRKVVSPLSGRFNVYNLMAVIGCLAHFDISVTDIIKCIENLKPVEARQTEIELGQPFKVMVDYAHTANSVANLVKFLRNTRKVGRLVIVVGAGGSRDVYRRTDMAEFCTANADYNYFTIEDARYEDPKMLVETMVSTVPDATNYELIVDRDEAISKAIRDAKPDDTILILGKGAERYMMTNGVAVERPNDIERAEMTLKEMGYNG